MILVTGIFVIRNAYFPLFLPSDVNSALQPKTVQSEGSREMVEGESDQSAAQVQTRLGSCCLDHGAQRLGSGCPVFT